VIVITSRFFFGYPWIDLNKVLIKKELYFIFFCIIYPRRLTEDAFLLTRLRLGSSQVVPEGLSYDLRF
jgi:hypothetical protein